MTFNYPTQMEPNAYTVVCFCCDFIMMRRPLFASHAALASVQEAGMYEGGRKMQDAG